MQENSTQRVGFGALLGRGWKLYARSVGTTFPTMLLCILPSLVALVVVYYSLTLGVLRPVMQILQTILQTVLTHGFDEWAVGEAVQQVLDGLETMDHELLLRQLLGSAGALAGAALIAVPLQLAATYLLTPVAQGVVMNGLSRGWHGVFLPLRQAFGAVKGRVGRLLVLNLVLMLGAAALSFALSVVAILAEFVPIAGPALSLLLSLGIAVSVLGVQSLTYLVAVNEDKWHFNALFYAAKRFFTDYAYACAVGVFVAVEVGVCLVTLTLDALLMVLALFPPVLTPLSSAFLAPLYYSLVTSVYYGQRKREGYAPECALK